MRDWLKKNPKAATGIITAALLISTGVLAYSLFFSESKPGTSSKFYYYDMKTQELFVDEADLVPPIKAPSGGEGVLAQVYACGDCSGELVVGILKKYTPKAKQAIENGLPPDPQGELIRLADPDSKWAPVDSSAGKAYRLESVANVKASCKDQSPKVCLPD